MPFIKLNTVPFETPHRTIVVMGVARSGTSMVASVLDALGIFMGKDMTKGSLEDREISLLLEKEYEEQALDQLLQQRNEEHAVWGWKRPGSIKHVDKFAQKLRNPLYIITFRDLAAIALRRTITAETELLGNIRHAHRQYQWLLEFLTFNHVPCLLVSNEDAVFSPDRFVRELVDFLQLEFAAETLQLAVDSIAVDDNPYLRSMLENKQKLAGQ